MKQQGLGALVGIRAQGAFSFLFFWLAFGHGDGLLQR
jgi:hypothetical protein